MSMTRSDETGTVVDGAHHAVPSTLLPKKAWEVIDDARRSRITGELALTTASPAKTKVYLDSGKVYFAERETDESLATRLVLAGAIDPDQLHKGSLRLNGVEHLGRLFERDATVERDAVELALELMTEQTLTEVAQQEVLSSQITMYRQHSSGVGRWFTVPSSGPTPVTGEVATLRSSPWQPPTSQAVEAVRQTNPGNVFEVEESYEPKTLPTLPAPSAITASRQIPRPPVNRLEQSVVAPLSQVPENIEVEAPAVAEVLVEVVQVEVAEVEVAEVEAVEVEVAEVEAVDLVEARESVESVERAVETIDPIVEPLVESAIDQFVDEPGDAPIDVDITAEIAVLDDVTQTEATPETTARTTAETTAKTTTVTTAETTVKTTVSGLQSMTPLVSLKSFMPMTSSAHPVAPTTTEVDLAELVSAVAHDSADEPTAPTPTALTPTAPTPTVPTPTAMPQRAALSSLQPMTRQPMTPLQPMNLQQLTPYPNTSSGTTGQVPHTISRLSKPNDPDLSSIPVPEEVAAAVRRAIEAIESAMHEPTAPSVSFGPMHVTAPGQAALANGQVHDSSATVSPADTHADHHLNGHGHQGEVSAQHVAQPTGAKTDPILAFGELSSDGAVYPLPVLPPLAPRGKRAPVSEQRRGALRRLIAGVRRR